jgi:hypothetical protein
MSLKKTKERYVVDLKQKSNKKYQKSKSTFFFIIIAYHNNACVRLKRRKRYGFIVFAVYLVPQITRQIF